MKISSVTLLIIVAALVQLTVVFSEHSDAHRHHHHHGCKKDKGKIKMCACSDDNNAPYLVLHIVQGSSVAMYTVIHHASSGGHHSSKDGENMPPQQQSGLPAEPPPHADPCSPPPVDPGLNHKYYPCFCNNTKVRGSPEEHEDDHRHEKHRHTEHREHRDHEDHERDSSGERIITKPKHKEAIDHEDDKENSSEEDHWDHTIKPRHEEPIDHEHDKENGFEEDHWDHTIKPKHKEPTYHEHDKENGFDEDHWAHTIEPKHKEPIDHEDDKENRFDEDHWPITTKWTNRITPPTTQLPGEMFPTEFEPTFVPLPLSTKKPADSAHRRGAYIFRCYVRRYDKKRRTDCPKNWSVIQGVMAGDDDFHTENGVPSGDVPPPKRPLPNDDVHDSESQTGRKNVTYQCYEKRYKGVGTIECARKGAKDYGGNPEAEDSNARDNVPPKRDLTDSGRESGVIYRCWVKRNNKLRRIPCPKKWSPPAKPGTFYDFESDDGFVRRCFATYKNKTERVPCPGQSSKDFETEPDELPARRPPPNRNNRNSGCKDGRKKAVFRCYEKINNKIRRIVCPKDLPPALGVDSVTKIRDSRNKMQDVYDCYLKIDNRITRIPCPNKEESSAYDYEDEPGEPSEKCTPSKNILPMPIPKREKKIKSFVIRCYIYHPKEEQVPCPKKWPETKDKIIERPVTLLPSAGSEYVDEEILEYVVDYFDDDIDVKDSDDYENVLVKVGKICYIITEDGMEKHLPCDREKRKPKQEECKPITTPPTHVPLSLPKCRIKPVKGRFRISCYSNDSDRRSKKISCPTNTCSSIFPKKHCPEYRQKRDLKEKRIILSE